MQFRPWKPSSSDVYIRFYVVGREGEFLSKIGNRIQVTSPSNARKIEITRFLHSVGIDIQTVGLRELAMLLDEKGLTQSSNHTRGRTYHQESRFDQAMNNVIGEGRFKSRNAFGKDSNFSFSDSSLEQLYNEALHLDVSSAPFKDSTYKDAIVLVDHREPAELFNKLSSTGIKNVHPTSLPDGDILVTSQSDPSRVLLIERKTLTDLYNNITSDNHHAHEQAERYYRSMVSNANEGIYMQVVWIVEGERKEQGQIRTLYNVLPQVKQMDGWLNYISAICCQQTIQTFNLNHTAYMVAKLIQGFVEQSLYYPVKVRNMRVDMSSTERKKMNKALIQSDSEPSHKGVISASDGLKGILAILPGINTKVAYELAMSGKSLAEIVNMTENELLEIKGIGNKTAKQIFKIFNLKGENNDN
ncbi:helix-hairpin-helix domain-containing protein (plasmid) [Vibrio parahaemolyticus]|nr:helix-hairpin-helix domain-containing protein [Vibrio parahaemolyticus]